jgi:hypothetical protein
MTTPSPRKLTSLPCRSAAFIEPMECLAVSKLPDGPEWVYEIKLDGYRAIAVKSAGKLNLFSRRRNSFNRQYSLVFEALADVPDNTVVDGEVVALNEAGHPDFNLLQHYRTGVAQSKAIIAFGDYRYSPPLLRYGENSGRVEEACRDGSIAWIDESSRPSATSFSRRWGTGPLRQNVRYGRFRSSSLRNKYQELNSTGSQADKRYGRSHFHSDYVQRTREFGSTAHRLVREQ